MKEQRYRELFDYDLDGILSLDLEGRVVSANDSCKELLGYSVGDLLGMTLERFVTPQDSERFSESFGKVAAGEPQNVEATAVHKSANQVELHMVMVPISVEEKIVGVSIIARDVTGRQKLEEQLLHEALHDPLTGLVNRSLFADRLDHTLAKLARSEAAVALLLVDLDEFKLTNDRFGHVVGDEVLKWVGDLLRSSLRPTDTAARLGGDEFAILVEDDLQTAGHAVSVAERILERFKEPVLVQGRELSITASIGIAVATPAHHDRPEELMREADLAMYQAKSKGKNRCDTFDLGLVDWLEDPSGLSRDLEDALSRKEFKVYYQPLVSLETGKIVEVEALLRWEHPENGLLSPDKFLPLLEQKNLMVPVGQWLLEEACYTVHEWQEQYPDSPPLKLSANLSVKELRHPDLVQEILATLRKTNLEPGSLQIEVTENLMLEDEELSLRKLRQLKGLGLEITIDDFGVGHSSLRLLKQLPKDDLKIDKSFIDGLGIHDEDTVIVKAIVDLAHDLGLQVTAEGVENSKQAAHLRMVGCDMAQGYHFSPPMNSETMSARLKLASA